jgi:hypothetical protein
MRSCRKTKSNCAPATWGPLIDLKSLGCSAHMDFAPLAVITNPTTPEGYAARFFPHFGFFLAISLVLSLGVYAIVRALGVIAGAFARLVRIRFISE